MQYLEILLSLLTVVLGGGWFVSYRAYKRKASGEATQAEADGWKGQQEVYQRTIKDLTETCEYIKKDRDLLRKENEELRKENAGLRAKVNSMEEQMQELRREIARQGRRIDAIKGKKNK